MFFNKSIKEDISKLENKFDNTKTELRNEFNLIIGKLENDIEKKLIEFHKEITERYFETLEKIFRLNKEISLINTLAGQVKDKDFADLKAQMMQPLLEARWAEKRKEDGQKIINNGEKIILQRQALHNEMLLMEKKGQDISKMKEQLKVYDAILEEIKK